MRDYSRCYIVKSGTGTLAKGFSSAMYGANFMALFYRWGSTTSRLQIHYKDSV